jgi:hypothetical protein
MVILLAFSITYTCLCQIHHKEISYSRNILIPSPFKQISDRSFDPFYEIDKKSIKDSIEQNHNIQSPKPIAGTITKFLGASLLTGLLMITDEPSWKYTHSVYKKSSAIKTGVDYSVYIGDGKFSFALAGLFVIDGFLENNYKAKKTSYEIVESMLISGITVQSLKRIFGRESPAACSRESGKWNFLPNLHEYNKHQTKYYAFPSGHITTITSTLTVIANNFPEYKWFKPLSYGIIGLVGVGLVAKNMHWYSDLPIGVFLGYSIGNLISRPKNNVSSEDHEKNDEYLKLSPYINLNHSGVQLSFHF